MDFLWSVFSHIWTKYGDLQTIKAPCLDTFHAVFRQPTKYCLDTYVKMLRKG